MSTHATLPMSADAPVRGGIPNLSYLVMLLAIATLPFSAVRIKGSMSISDVFIIASFVTMLYESLFVGRRVWIPWWWAAAAACFIFSFLLRALLLGGLFDYDDFVNLSIVLFAGFIFPLCLANQPCLHERQVGLLLKIWVIASVTGALFAILHDRGIWLPLADGWLHRTGPREAGLTLHPNSLGFVSSLAVPICLALGLAEQSAKKFMLWMAGLGLLFYAIDLTGSRSALVSSIVASGVVIGAYILLKNRSPSFRRHSRIILVLVALIGVYQLREGGNNETAWKRIFASDSAEVRTSNIMREIGVHASLDAFGKRPFFGSGFQEFVGWRNYASNPHNVYLGVLASSGLSGFLGFAILNLGALYCVATVLVRARRGQASFPFAIGIFASFLVWLLSGLKQMPLMDRNAYVPFAFAALMYVCLLRNRPVGKNPLVESGEIGTSAADSTLNHRSTPVANENSGI